ncbi:NADPH-dependent FMN reductase [Vibrio neptunius]|uniref:NAD(P)H-dependent oxidoreductase n=1 Tax=Vibrio neptunius TaxID=170651 RepID=A0ABS3A920_9VIBR|nr:NADPH-dependent FMN reductase [Vibrio neptunius]MBN3495711.1 NAD(P)H-dependent oxidoreductase [Vibrio neptunius]MBN3518197.1 NAD(P)H-dependent oxidoreductase [Vibrio neptunius]MBN3552485.1 NAD(P)H-dependent oxidoreductase [Vibrio neptunius]MBN3580595.1 NAD(P)H-dependent oxidoreductase [Vibrio neptunius]MCH9874261.1 NAD(P)H-dependent oxidoreductase [Vibrio neptunius]
MKKILAISGSNHAQSINTKLLKHAISHIETHAVTYLDMTEYPLPIYSQDIEAAGIPENAKVLWDIFASHDALIFSVPEHNGFMPVFLKNVIDWLSRIATKDTGFFGTPNVPVLLLSTSPGANGGATSLQTMKSLMPWWGAEVTAAYSLGNFNTHFLNEKFAHETTLVIKQLVSDFEKNV